MGEEAAIRLGFGLRKEKNGASIVAEESEPYGKK